MSIEVCAGQAIEQVAPNGIVVPSGISPGFCDVALGNNVEPKCEPVVNYGSQLAR